MRTVEVLEAERKIATAEVEREFASLPETRDLTPEELAPHKAVRGWRILRETPSAKYALDVVLPGAFPYVLPQVWVNNPDPGLALRNAHVMRSGQLCLFPEGSSIAIDCPGSVAIKCLAEALDLLEAGDIEGYKSEFASHWSRYCDDGAGEVIIVDRPDQLVGPVSAVPGERLTAIGSERKSIEKWMLNRLPSKGELNDPRPCWASRFNEPISPIDYPSTLKDLIALLEARDLEGATWLKNHAISGTTPATLILIQDAEPGPALAALEIPPLNLGSHSGLAKGWRPGTAPPHVILGRGKSLVAGHPVQKQTVQRADHGWIHTRGGDGNDLSKKSVCVLGCGSLGGYVAHLLARSGFGRLTLVDNQALSFNNIGRHILGASDVDARKSNALARNIRAELPHLEINSVAADWRRWCVESPDNFHAHDLIVSTMGDWASEHALNSMTRRSQQMPPVIFSWLEPYALAGHAVLVGDAGGCLGCGLSVLGQHLSPVSGFDRKTLIQEPGGCEYYQQYGPASLMPVASMIASVAINATQSPVRKSQWSFWIGSRDLFTSTGARVTPAWQNHVEERGFGITGIHPWHKNSRCALCR